MVLTPLAETAVGVNQHDQFALAGATMLVAVGLVLLIACANLANLLLAQAARREKEMTVRAALGAGRGRLLRQLLTESTLLSLAGAVVGLVLAYWGRGLLWSYRPSFIQQNDVDLALDSHVLLFTLGIALLTGALFGAAPAIKASSPDLADTLKAGGRGNSVGWRSNPVRSLLVVVETALALVALVGAGLFIRSQQNAQKIDPGFESEKLFVMAVDLGALHYKEGQAQQFYRSVVERASSAPGVQSATIAANFPMGGGFSRTVFPEGQDEASGYRGTLTTTDSVAPNYFDTLRIPILEGHGFTDNDRKETRQVAVVSDAMAKHFWPNESAVGKRFHFFGDTGLREIVGVSGNTVQNQIGDPPQPVVYLPMTQEYSPFATVQVRTKGDPDAAIGTVRSVVQVARHQSRDHQRADHSRNHEPGVVGAAHGRSLAHTVRRVGADPRGCRGLRRAVLFGEPAAPRNRNTPRARRTGRRRNAPGGRSGHAPRGGRSRSRPAALGRFRASAC